MTAPREQPSWLMLERYAQGELAESDRLAVQQALSNDPLSAECVTRIQTETRALPPLPAFKPTVPIVSPPLSTWTSWWLSWRVGATLATIAAIGLLVLLPNRTSAPLSSTVPSAPSSVKGDALAISLIRERDGSVAWDSTLFGLGDRFKVRVTCAVPGAVFAGVVVHQGGATSFPIESQAIVCGNQVVLHGAFRLSELVPARVCVVLSTDGPIARERLVQSVSPTDACAVLRPAR